MNSEEAFKVLRKQVNEEIEAVRKANQDLMNRNQFVEAQRMAEKAESLRKMKSGLAKLHREWGKAFSQGEMLPGIEGAVTTRGIKTPEEAYYIPILRALVEKNGRGRTSVIVDRVGEMMAGELNNFDRQRLNTGNRPRWRNTAEWARNELKERGFIKSGSPYGIWEISDEGREYLKEQGG